VADAEFTPGQAQQAVAAAKAANPDAVILVSRDGAQGAIAELNNAGLAGKKLVLSDGAVSKYGAGLGARALEGARGILPGVFPSAAFQADLVAVDPGLKDMVFAAETYDAVVLAAVAAAAAEDDAGTSIAASLVAVSGGTPAAGGTGAGGSQPPSESCTSYKDCVGVLRAGQRPDYDGQSGRINFDAHGDITEANYMVSTYGEDNLPTVDGTEAASSSGG
jgi:branched-chain amino acid transport system substrate-binding protein